MEGTRNDDSKYHPDITEEAQQQLEMDCVRTQQPFRTVKHKRMFWMNLNRCIGASCGEETTYLYAEWLANGEVHGWPISVQQLREKGAVV